MANTPNSASTTARIPLRTMLLAITLFWLSFLVVRLLGQLTNIITYIVIASFFAMLLTPAVDWCVRRLRLSRGWAALAVFLGGLIAVTGMLYLFIQPLADKAPEFAKTFPAYIENVKHCADKDPQANLCPKGATSDIIRRLHLADRLDQFGEQTAKAVDRVKQNAADIASTVGRAVAGTLTVLVLVVLMLLHGAEILNRFISPLSKPSQERLRRLGRESARTVTSYMLGNVLISIIAGVSTLIALTVFGVRFKAALAVWVGVADLIPLVGATIGAVPVVLVAFIGGVKAGIGMLIFFIFYQQFENHVLQVTIMSRTVALDPLIVLVSVLIGVQLFGILGGLLAIPVAGASQVIVRDLVSSKTESKESTAPAVDTKV